MLTIEGGYRVGWGCGGLNWPVYAHYENAVSVICDELKAKHSSNIYLPKGY